MLRFFDNNFDPYIKQSIKSKINDIKVKSQASIQEMLYNSYHDIKAKISTPQIILPLEGGEIYTLTAGEMNFSSIKNSSDNDQYSHFHLNMNGMSLNVFSLISRTKMKKMCIQIIYPIASFNPTTLRYC